MVYKTPLHSFSWPNRNSEEAMDRRTKQSVGIQIVAATNLTLKIDFFSAGVKLLEGLPHPWANEAQDKLKFTIPSTYLNYQSMGLFVGRWGHWTPIEAR